MCSYKYVDDHESMIPSENKHIICTIITLMPSNNKLITCINDGSSTCDLFAILGY